MSDRLLLSLARDAADGKIEAVQALKDYLTDAYPNGVRQARTIHLASIDDESDDGHTPFVAFLTRKDAATFIEGMDGVTLSEVPIDPSAAHRDAGLVCYEVVAPRHHLVTDLRDLAVITGVAVEYHWLTLGDFPRPHRNELRAYVWAKTDDEARKAANVLFVRYHELRAEQTDLAARAGRGEFIPIFEINYSPSPASGRPGHLGQQTGIEGTVEVVRRLLGGAPFVALVESHAKSSIRSMLEDTNVRNIIHLNVSHGQVTVRRIS